MVLGARRLAWSRELVSTSLVVPVRVPVWETALVPRTLRRRRPPYPSLRQGDRHDPRKQKNGRVGTFARATRVANPHAAGIDVARRRDWVVVPPDHLPGTVGVDVGLATQ